MKKDYHSKQTSSIGSPYRNPPPPPMASGGMEIKICTILVEFQNNIYQCKINIYLILTFSQFVTFNDRCIYELVLKNLIKN